MCHRQSIRHHTMSSRLILLTVEMYACCYLLSIEIRIRVCLYVTVLRKEILLFTQ